MKSITMIPSSIFPLDWNSPCLGEEASNQEVSTQVRQQEELATSSSDKD